MSCAPAPVPDDGGYLYGAAWKAAVDRHGHDWRAYCEAVHCLKTYYRDQLEYGKEAALDRYRAYCDDVAARPGGVARAERLRIDVQLVGRHEGRALRALMQAESPRCLDAAAA